MAILAQDFNFVVLSFGLLYCGEYINCYFHLLCIDLHLVILIQEWYCLFHYTPRRFSFHLDLLLPVFAVYLQGEDREAVAKDVIKLRSLLIHHLSQPSTLVFSSRDPLLNLQLLPWLLRKLPFTSALIQLQSKTTPVEPNLIPVHHLQESLTLVLFYPDQLEQPLLHLHLKPLLLF